MVMRHMLSTVDNPYNPFTNYDEWLVYDLGQGYNSNAFLARVAYSSDELSDADQAAAIELAIDEIVRENSLGLFKKVSQEVSL